VRELPSRASAEDVRSGRWRRLAITGTTRKLSRHVPSSSTRLEQRGPRHPGLQSHAYHSVPGPGGATLGESYVENKTPSAWRIWWIYGPAADQITIVTVGPHP